MDDLPAKRSPSALTRPDEDDETIRCVLRTISRLGPWEPPETMRLVSVLGSIVLDYGEADLPLGVTEVECEVYFGTIEIHVPADIDLELTGSIVLGSVETKGGKSQSRWRRKAREVLLGESPDEVEEDDEEERPLLSVHCSGFMGNVEIKLT